MYADEFLAPQTYLNILNSLFGSISVKFLMMVSIFEILSGVYVSVL